MERTLNPRLVIPVLLTLAAVVVVAAGPTRMSRHVTGGGGGPKTSGAVTLDGTVGQHAVGTHTGGDVTLRSGYWVPAGTVADAPGETVPAKPAILGNAPNPFNPMTEIRYSVGREPRRVRMRIYDIQGRLVRTLVDGVGQPGVHKAVWQGRDDAGGQVSSGIYFCRLQVGAENHTHKMMLLK